jgi:hypothetical protein
MKKKQKKKKTTKHSQFKNTKVDGTVDYAALAAATEGCSGADIKELCRAAVVANYDEAAAVRWCCFFNGFLSAFFLPKLFLTPNFLCRRACSPWARRTCLQ